jgi:integrase
MDPTNPSGVFNGLEPWVKRTVERLPPANRRRAIEFLDELRLGGASNSTLEGYVLMLKALRTNGKRFEELTREDILGWLRWLDSNGFRPSTVNALRARAKRFLRWVHTRDDPRRKVPKHIQEIKIKRERRELPKRILTELEVRKLVDACVNQRDRALIFTAYESGCRAGEILGARIGDLEFDPYGAVLRVRGKTGERRVRLVQCVPDLKLWLSMHPCKGDPNAPLWPTRLRSRKQMSISEFEELLAKYSRLASIGKHVYPHLLRHSRATHLANVLTEAQMRQYFGWAGASSMPSVYVHLSGRDVDAKLLEYYGIRVEREKQAQEALAPKRCPSCGHENPPSSLYCGRCHAPLGVEAVARLWAKRERADEFVGEVVEELIKRAPGLVERILARHKERLAELAKASG